NLVNASRRRPAASASLFSLSSAPSVAIEKLYFARRLGRQIESVPSSFDAPQRRRFTSHAQELFKKAAGQRSNGGKMHCNRRANRRPIGPQEAARRGLTA